MRWEITRSNLRLGLRVGVGNRARSTRKWQLLLRVPVKRHDYHYGAHERPNGANDNASDCAPAEDINGSSR